MLRHTKNPILTRLDIPPLIPELTDVTSVFNPGAVRFGEYFLLLLRVQSRSRRTFLMKALSSDGIVFKVVPKLITYENDDYINKYVHHVYDPRITYLNGDYHIVTAMDTSEGCYLGYFTTNDFEHLVFQGIVSEKDVRNGVLFSEKINGKFYRFERPNQAVLENGVKTGKAICCSASDDLRRWHTQGVVLQGNPYYWDELIGSGPPPIKTRYGWLHIYHGVATHFGSNNIYQAGVSLQALDNPCQLLARGTMNILEPREMYELIGQVPNVVFPSGAIALNVDQEGYAVDDSPVYVYYGAADTCVCLAITSVKELIQQALL